MPPSRNTFTAIDTVEFLWKCLGLPGEALNRSKIVLQGYGAGYASSFKIGHLAQSSIALSTLTAALFYAGRKTLSSISSSSSTTTTTTTDGKTPTPIILPRVSVSLRHACAEFLSERLYLLDGVPPPSVWGAVGGLHATADGHVRIHDVFPHHCAGIKKLLGCPVDAERADVAAKVAEWKAVDLETAAVESNSAVVAALRSYAEWDAHPQSKAVSDIPVVVQKISSSDPYQPSPSTTNPKSLSGIRILELSRVIAGPVCGRSLAAHGADVLWVTSPNLPALPDLDIDLSRGKRSIQLDLNISSDKATFLALARDADVLIQSYRPGSLAGRGLDAHTIARLNPNGMVVANLSAYGSLGPWAQRRGFDSLVQTCTGMNVSEAEHFVGDSSVPVPVTPRPTPCQALDHASGYLLAAGVNAALWRRAHEGGSYEVEASLAGVAKYLRSLGQWDGRGGFDMSVEEKEEEEGGKEEFMETRESGFGMLTAVKHSGRIEGVDVGWEIMPKPLGSDEARWLE